MDATIIDDVYNTLCKNRMYNAKTEEWKGLPKNEKKESRYYKPFVNIVETIRTAFKSPGAVALSCSRIDQYSTTPQVSQPGCLDHTAGCIECTRDGTEGTPGVGDTHERQR